MPALLIPPLSFHPAELYNLPRGAENEHISDCSIMLYLKSHHHTQGYCYTKPEVILRLEQAEDPCLLEKEFLIRRSSEPLSMWMLRKTVSCPVVYGRRRSDTRDGCNLDHFLIFKSWEPECISLKIDKSSNRVILNSKKNK
nr:uncharacterized protein LOC129046027 isoform X1 [Mirounga angustirostris]